MDRLKQLVFSFYREETELQPLLVPLKACRFSREGETIHVECENVEHLEAVEELLIYLSKPFLFLALGRRIVFQIPGSIDRIHSLQNSSFTDLLS